MSNTVASSTDTGSTGLSTTPLQPGQGQFQSTANSMPNIMTPPNITSEEFIAPNNNFGKYFTCEDARLYIGDVFIDEGIYVQYTLQYNKIPLYGYRSTFYDAVAQGRSIVQGQIGINFVSEGYLYTVLNEYNKLSANTTTSDQDTLNNLFYTEQQLLTTNSSYNSAQLSLVQTQKAQLIAKLGPSSIDSASNFLKGINAPAPISGKSMTNALYLDIPFTLVLNLNGANRNVTRRLEGCQLIANDQVINSDGNTLTDGYSFIARKLR